MFDITACGGFSRLIDDCVTSEIASVFIDMGESPDIVQEEEEEEEEEEKVKT